MPFTQGKENLARARTAGEEEPGQGMDGRPGGAARQAAAARGLAQGGQQAGQTAQQPWLLAGACGVHEGAWLGVWGAWSAR